MSPRLLLHAVLQLSYAIHCASYIANGGRGPLLLRSLRALPPLGPRAPRSPRAQEDSDGYDPAQSSIFDNEMQVSLEAGKKVLQCKVLETLTYRDALYCSMSPMDIPAAIGYLDKDGEMQVEAPPPLPTPLPHPPPSPPPPTPTPPPIATSPGAH